MSRSTFYTYYDSQYDLLEDIQNEIISHLQDQFGGYKVTNDKKETYKRYEQFFQYVAENSDSIKVIISENGDINFLKKIIKQFTVSSQKAMTVTHDESADEKTKRIYTIFLIHGGIALIQDWIKQGTDIPAPKMAKILNKIINSFM